MKLIALIAFKNEEQFLKYILPQLTEICDVILGHDDDSTDKSRQIFAGFGGILIPRARSLKWGNGGEYQVRSALLEAGRKNGGTHFVCLDADELFTTDILRELSESISALQPGFALSLKWISCWIDSNTGQLTYQPNAIVYKDFIFADKAGLEFPHGMIHISRTPTNATHHIRSSSSGGVLHLQNLNYENFLAKQLWYQLSEVVFSNHPYFYLDYKYLSYTRKPKDLIAIEPDQYELAPEVFSNSKISLHWRLEIILMLREVSLEKIEFLGMWKNQVLAEVFEEYYGFPPRKKPRIIYVLEKLKLWIFVLRSWFANLRSRNFN